MILLLVIIFAIFASSVAKVLSCGWEVPHHLPWAGEASAGPLTRVKLYLRSILSTSHMVIEGYEKYSKRGLAFVLPNLFTGAEILLPPTELNWIHDQPEHILSNFEAHRQFMRADWTLLHPTIIKEHVFADVIKRQLTRDLDKLEPILAEEVSAALSQFNVAEGDEPLTANGYSSWKRIILQVVSSIYVGRPLCRNEKYLTNASRFNGTSMLTAGLIGLIPRLLRPLIAPLICLPDRYFHSRCASMTTPLLKERLDAVRNFGMEEKHTNLPVDLITWATRDACTNPNQSHEKTSINFLAARISVMNFVSIDSTTITISNLLFDVLSFVDDSKPTSLFRELQLEAESAYSRHGNNKGQFKAVLANLPILDSCLKESFRLGNFISRSIVKMVVAPEGVDVPGVGHVRQGVKVGIPLWGIHHDDADYDDAYRWRYSRWLEDDEQQRLSIFGGHASQVGEKYLPFGFRRVICPGRFFAMRVVKLILLHLLLGYDVEMANDKRPENGWLGVSRGPPMNGKLIIRPRKDPVVLL